jgi:shikimate kinase
LRAWPTAWAERRSVSGWQRIVLVGLPGAGKSTVGPLVAERLGWAFVDLDLEIERTAGRTVPEIFAHEGEEGFRRRERGATLAMAEWPGLVLAPGGGWLLDPTNLKALGAGTEVVHLQVSPAVAAVRLGPASARRPLLAGPSTVQRLEELWEARKSIYLQANHTLSVDLLSPDAAASYIVALASRGTGD